MQTTYAIFPHPCCLSLLTTSLRLQVCALCRSPRVELPFFRAIRITIISLKKEKNKKRPLLYLSHSSRKEEINEIALPRQVRREVASSSKRCLLSACFDKREGARGSISKTRRSLRSERFANLQKENLKDSGTF